MFLSGVITKVHFSTIVAVALMSFYTLLIIVVVEGFWGNVFIVHLHGYFFLSKITRVIVLICVVCVVLNAFLFFVVSRYGVRQSVIYTVILSLPMGLVFFFVSENVSLISNALYDHGFLHIYRDGDDGEAGREQRAMSFFVRYLVVCFSIGGICAVLLRRVMSIRRGR